MGVCFHANFKTFSSRNAVGYDLQYRIRNTALDFVELHRKLAVLINSEQNFNYYAGEVTGKAAVLVSSLFQSTVNRSPEFMVVLFITHIRPIWIIAHVSIMLVVLPYWNLFREDRQRFME